MRAVLSRTVVATAQVAMPQCKDDTHRIEQCTIAIQAQDVTQKGVTGVFSVDRKPALRYIDLH